MKKFYIVASFKNGLLCGVYSPGTDYPFPLGEEATQEQQDAADALLATIENDTDHAPVRENTLRVFNRKSARNAVAVLGNQWWDWRVLEVGDATPRDVRPVLGWRIWNVRGAPMVSTFNLEGYGATIRSPNGMDMYHDGDAGLLFPTRKAARAVVAKFVADQSNGWKKEDFAVRPAYTAWRATPLSMPKGMEGGCSFRTKADAESWLPEFGDCRVHLSEKELPDTEYYHHAR